MIKNTSILCLKQSPSAGIKKSHFHLCHFFKASNHSRAAFLTFESSAAQIKLSQIAIISHQGFPTEKKPQINTVSRIRNLTLLQNILGNKRNGGKQSRSSDRKRRVKWSHDSAAAPGTPGILLEQNKPPPFTGCQLFHGKKPWEKLLLCRGLQICSFLSLRENSPHSAEAKKELEPPVLHCKCFCSSSFLPPPKSLCAVRIVGQRVGFIQYHIFYGMCDWEFVRFESH